MRSINERLPDNHEETLRLLQDQTMNRLRVAMPGIIQAFDPDVQTVTVQPAIRELVRKGNFTADWVDLPLLLDVPVLFPRAGGFALTFPVAKGDECLIVFADMCYDAFWSLGGIQNQIEKRRHDLSDGVAIVGLSSQPRRLDHYHQTGAELRNDSGDVRIRLSNNAIDIQAPTVTINGINFSSHVHSSPQGGTTGGPQ